MYIFLRLNTARNLNTSPDAAEEPSAQCGVTFSLATCRILTSRRNFALLSGLPDTFLSGKPAALLFYPFLFFFSSCCSSSLSCFSAAGFSSGARQTLSSPGFFSLPGLLWKLHQYVNDLIFKHLKKPLINIDLNTCHQWLTLIQCKWLIHKLQRRAICEGLPTENGRGGHWSRGRGWNEADPQHQKMTQPFSVVEVNKMFNINNLNRNDILVKDVFSTRPPTVNMRTVLGLALQAAMNKTLIYCYFISVIYFQSRTQYKSSKHLLLSL